MLKSLSIAKPSFVRGLPIYATNNVQICLTSSYFISRGIHSSSTSKEESPEMLIQKSALKNNPIDYSNNAPVKSPKKLSKLAHSKYESSLYKLPKWKSAMGELVIRLFRLDMDRVRAGPIAGSRYYNMCKEQGLQYENEEMNESAKFFYEQLKLPKTFSQWFQITILHEWMLFTRMRAMPFEYGHNYQQKLVDRTFTDIEARLCEEMNVTSGTIIGKYQKDFNTQLRGAIFAYDEGFYTDDATLASALWRNLFGGRKNIDMVHLEAVVRYVRSQIYVLSMMSDRDFALGNFRFVPPNESIERLTPSQEALLKKRVIEKYEKQENLLPSEQSRLSYTN